MSLSVLVVCSANVCRSPTCEIAMRRAAAAAGLDDLVSVASAGLRVEIGAARCDQAEAWLREPLPPHVGRETTPEVLAAADLVLAVDRTVRDECARLGPSSRPRLFTVRQGALLAATVADALMSGKLPPDAPPLPEGPDDRLAWLVGEMDAARVELGGRSAAEDDIADQHGPARHADVFDAIGAAVATFVGALAATVAAPS